MKHCSVIFSSKFCAYCRERAVDKGAAHVHGDLTGLHDVALPRLGKKSVSGYVEVLADYLLYLVDSDIVLFFPHYLAGNLLGKLDSDLLVDKGRIGYYRYQRSLKLPEIGLDAGGQIYKDVFTYHYSLTESPCLEHLEPCGIGRHLELYGKSPFHPGEKSFLEVLEICRSAVRSEDQLLAVLVQMVEDVEECALTSLADEILDIIDYEHIDLHVKRYEVSEFVPDMDSIHVLGLELVSGDIEHHEVRIFLLYGDNSDKDNLEIRTSLKNVSKQESLILIATGQKIGEGFDFPRLDVLMLAAPVSFEGRLEQYVGRLNRDYEGKEAVFVYDYIDSHVKYFDRMYGKRLRTYKKMGFSLWSEETKTKQTINAIFDSGNYTEKFEQDLIENTNLIMQFETIILH